MPSQMESQLRPGPNVPDHPVVPQPAITLRTKHGIRMATLALAAATGR